MFAVRVFHAFPYFIFLLNVDVAVLFDLAHVLLDTLFHVSAQVFDMLAAVDIVRDFADALHVFRQINDVAGYNAWNVIPLVLLVSKRVVDETVLELMLFNLFEELFLLLPLMHLHFLFVAVYVSIGLFLY